MNGQNVAEIMKKELFGLLSCLQVNSFQPNTVFSANGFCVNVNDILK